MYFLTLKCFLYFTVKENAHLRAMLTKEWKVIKASPENIIPSTLYYEGKPHQHNKLTMYKHTVHCPFRGTSLRDNQQQIGG